MANCTIERCKLLTVERGKNRYWGSIGLGSDDGYINFSYFGDAILTSGDWLVNVKGRLRSYKTMNNGWQVAITINSFSYPPKQGDLDPTNNNKLDDWLSGGK